MVKEASCQPKVEMSGLHAGRYGPDAGPFGSPGPTTVDTSGGATLAATLRLPTPTSLSGFSFTCSGS